MLKNKTLFYVILGVCVLIILGVGLLVSNNSGSTPASNSTPTISPGLPTPTTPTTQIPTDQTNKCDVGREIISASERPNYDCESMDGCEWRPLGGEIESHYACCPKDVAELKDKFSKYGRCFIMID